MIKRIVHFILLLIFISKAADSYSQNDSLSLPAHYHVAVFTPLYLDSAFNAQGAYRYAKQFPKYMSPGLEFWEGAELAIDSLRKEGVQISIHVYDTRSSTTILQQVLQKEEMDSMNLFIGHVGAYEAKLLADLAEKKDIPFINANFPNDAGVTNNPHFIILNSTLLTHCTGIYKFMQSNYALARIIMFSKKGQQEERLLNYFNTVEHSTASVPLKIKTVMLKDDFTAADITKNLDINKTSVCVVGSLDANFGQEISKLLSSVSQSYATIVIGMPTWDVIDFTKPEFKGIEILYSTPFYINPDDKLVAFINDHYKNIFFVRPTDMIFRGYETLYHFGHLLLLHDKNLDSNLNDKKYKLFSDFDIQPVYSKPAMRLDYYENKKLYFIKKEDGIVKAVY